MYCVLTFPRSHRAIAEFRYFLARNSPQLFANCFFQMNASAKSAAIDQIRRQYHAYKGGQFELSKDDSTGLATLCINNSARKNALSGAMMAQFTDIVAELEQWKEVSSLLFVR